MQGALLLEIAGERAAICARPSHGFKRPLKQGIGNITLPLAASVNKQALFSAGLNSRQKRETQMLRWLGRLLSDVLAHLPVVLFLVSLCVIAHDSKPYAKVEGLSVMLVGSLAPEKDLPESTAPIVALTAKPEFFYSADAYDGRLPLNRETTAKVVTSLSGGEPSIIALDVDVALAGTSEKEKAESKQLTESIRKALVAGIDVVAVTYPQKDSNRRNARDESLKTLCTELQPSAIKPAVAAKKPPGVFVLASPMVPREQPFEIVYRVSNDAPTSDEKDHRLFAVISSLREKKKEKPAANYCNGDQLDSAALHQIDKDDREWPDLKDMHRVRFMDDRSEPSVVGLPLLSTKDLEGIAKGLKNRTVLFGVQSFDGIDEFLTPFGKMPGAQLQAHIANSWSKGKDEDEHHKGMKEDHLKAALWDTAIGLAFVLVYMLMRNAFTWFDKWNAAQFSSSMRLVLPLLVFGGFLVGALWLSATQFAAGQWIDPLPIIFGLSLHLYAESSGGEHHRHITLPGWFAETVSTGRSISKLAGWPATLDWCLFILIRFVMVAAFFRAVTILAHHHFQPH